MTGLSIVIPTDANAASLEETLLSVLENRPANSEVIVVHQGDYDDPYKLGDEVRFIEAGRRASWIKRANLGTAHAGGTVVHLLRCGVRVRQDWAKPVLAHFDDPRVASVSPLVLDARNPGRVLAVGVGYQPWGQRIVLGRGLSPQALAAHPPPRILRRMLGPTLAAGFYRRSVWEAAGGLPSLGFAADIGLGMQTRRLGMEAVFEPASRVEREDADARPSAFCQGLYEQRLFWRNSRPRHWPLSVPLHLLFITGECLSQAARPWRLAAKICGRIAACCELPFQPRQHKPQGERIKPAAKSAVDLARQRLDSAHGENSRREFNTLGATESTARL